MLNEKSVPSWFSYPGEFKRIYDLKITNLDPWFLLEGEMLMVRYLGLKKRFPKRELIPFARRDDCDDIACWDKAGGNEKVFVIHDYASSGWENSGVYNNFWDWFRLAINDMIEHEQPYR